MALKLELADRVDTFACDHCGGEYPRVYGTIFDDDRRTGVYSADLHTHVETDERWVLLAIGTMGWDDRTREWQKVSVVIETWSTESEFQMGFRDSAWSPYKRNEYLGHVMDREEALASPLRDTFFHMADHIVADDPRVNGHLSPPGQRAQ